MSETPSTNGTQTARTPGGKFAPGNPGGPGNPNAAEVGKHRAAFFKAVRGSDVALAIKTLRRVMRHGRDSDAIAAAREILNRVIGVPVASDLLERLEMIEQQLNNPTAGTSGRSDPK
jgi:hypothetical protein